MDKRVLFCVLLLILQSVSPTLLYARSVGTTGAQFLEIYPGARATGMGGAFGAVEGDIYASYWNPAGLSSIPEPQVSATHIVWLESFSYNLLTYAQPVSDLVTVGGSVICFDGDDMARDKDMNELGEFGIRDLAGIVSTSYRITTRSSMGLNIKLISRKIGYQVARGMALDFGFRYNLFNSENTPVKSIPRLTLGICVQNIGRGLKFIRKRECLPLNVKYSVAFYLRDSRCLIAADMNVPLRSRVSYCVGLEYKIGSHFFFRYGLLMGGGYPETFVSRAGFGIHQGYGRLDYAYEYLGELGMIHRLTYTLDFSLAPSPPPIFTSTVK